MEIKVHQAKLSDLDALRQFLLSEYDYNKNDPDKATPDFFGLREEAIDEIISTLPEIISDDEIIFLLVKDAKRGHILGWAQIAPYENGTAEMSSLYLTKPARRKNIGDKVLNIVLDKARSRGYKEIFTIIQTNNLVAQHFLQKHGFKLSETFELDVDIFLEELRPLKVNKFHKKL